METLIHAAVKPWIEMLGWGLLHSLWQSVAVALVLAVLLKLYRKQAASILYGLAGMALCCVVALPVATACLYHAPSAAPLSEELESPLAPTVQPAFTSTEDLDTDSQPAAALPAETATNAPKAGKAVHVDKRDKAEVASMPWFTSTLQASFPWLVLGWLLGIFLLSIRHATGWRRLVKFRRSTTACAETRLITLFQSIKKRMGITKAAALTVSAQIKSPITIGWLKPVVCLPVFALSGLTTQQWEALLIHELAHVRRWDFVVNILQTWLEILVFYHPAAWWISRQIRLEREACCDDQVIRLTGQPVQYAKTLTSLASAAYGEPTLSMGASGSGFDRRIKRIISTRPGKCNTLKRACAPWLCFLTAMLMACCLPLSFLVGDTPKTEHRPIVFMSCRDSAGASGSQIYRINPDGTGEKCLISLRSAEHPVLSPDGKKVAFYAVVYKEDGDRSRWRKCLIVTDINGKHKKILMEDVGWKPYNFAWSPDSRKIVMRHGILSVNGDKVKGIGWRNLPVWLPEGQHSMPMQFPAWSPDGKWIACRAFEKNTKYHVDGKRSQPPYFFNLWVVSANGSSKAKMIHKIHKYGKNDWSPDSRQITFIKNGKVWVVNYDGTGEKQLTRDFPPVARTPSWSADGKTIVFAGVTRKTITNNFNAPVTIPHQDIYGIDMPSGKVRRITKTTYKYGASGPRVSPDGKQIVFQGKAGIGVVNVDGSGYRELTPSKFRDRAPDW